WCVDRLRLAAGSFTLADASGLSADNRMSAAGFTQALGALHAQLGPSFMETLTPQGHHAHAMMPVPPAGIRMWVKSGTLPASGVNTLVGYILIDGMPQPLTFAILVNRPSSGAPA